MRLPCGEEQRDLQEQEHTAEAHCRCVLKGSWVCGSFFGYGCHLLLFLHFGYVTATYSIFGYETVPVMDSCTLYPRLQPRQEGEGVVVGKLVSDSESVVWAECSGPGGMWVGC